MPENRRIETLIIGAGPAGLAAAIKLARSNKNFLVVEKDSKVGGLSKTFNFDGFRTDIGPHRFFSKNDQLYSFAENLLKEQWLEVSRQTRQFINGKFYDYPVRAAQALANIGWWKAGRMMTDYLIAQLQFTIFRKEIRNFENYIVANFGRSLGEFNMINYTEKIWGVPASTIHSDWARQRIRGLNVSRLIKNAISGALKNFRTENVRTLVDTFHYPEYGTGLIYDTITQELKERGQQVITNTQPIKIKHENNRITEVVFHGHRVSSRTPDVLISSIHPQNLIESIPINSFLHLLDPLPPSEVLAAAQKMKYRDQVYLFVTFDKERITRDQWIYFPERNIPFGRISEMKNFSQKMCPPGKTSLLIEFFCSKNDGIWNKPKEELLELTMKYLGHWGFCSMNEVISSHLIKKEKVYPIYDVNYKEYLAIVKNYLNQFKNLQFIGRPGRFRYNNQDHSLEMGFLAAKNVIEDQKHDIEAVGAELKYYEQKTSTFGQFIGYVVVAGIATIVDIAILFSLTEFLYVWYFNAAIIGYLCGTITNFSLGKVLVFNNRNRAIFRQFGIFTAVALVGLGINQIILYGLVEFANFWYLWAKFVAIAIASIWSFTGHKHLTFKIYR